MKELSCKSKTLLKTDRGSVVEIGFAGEYPPESVGKHAATMMDYVTQVVSKENPSAVLFNLTEYEYGAGDAIGQIVIPLLDHEKRSFKPACVVAKGRTAKALEWFFAPNVIFGIAGMKLFSDVAEGLVFLKKRLETA